MFWMAHKDGMRCKQIEEPSVAASVVVLVSGNPSNELCIPAPAVDRVLHFRCQLRALRQKLIHEKAMSGFEKRYPSRLPDVSK